MTKSDTRTAQESIRSARLLPRSAYGLQHGEFDESAPSTAYQGGWFDAGVPYFYTKLEVEEQMREAQAKGRIPAAVILQPCAPPSRETPSLATVAMSNARRELVGNFSLLRVGATVYPKSSEMVSRTTSTFNVVAKKARQIPV